jgi:hypothetical protein
VLGANFRFARYTGAIPRQSGWGSAMGARAITAHIRFIRAGRASEQKNNATRRIKAWGFPGLKETASPDFLMLTRLHASPGLAEPWTKRLP